MSSTLSILLAGAGLWTVALGIWHVGVPRFFAFDRALGHDHGLLPPLGALRLGRWTYERRRSDARGLTWVMSNAASFVLVSIGLLDIAWAMGERSIPIGLGASWVAAWWVIRAGGQAIVGRRAVDLALGAWFGGLAILHVVIVGNL